MCCCMLKLVKCTDKTEHKKIGGRSHSYHRSSSYTYKRQEVSAGIAQVCFKSVSQSNTVPLQNIKIAGSPNCHYFLQKGNLQSHPITLSICGPILSISRNMV